MYYVGTYTIFLKSDKPKGQEMRIFFRTFEKGI